jgi:hypothetical protein
MGSNLSHIRVGLEYWEEENLMGLRHAFVVSIAAAITAVFCTITRVAADSRRTLDDSPRALVHGQDTLSELIRKGDSTEIGRAIKVYMAPHRDPATAPEQQGVNRPFTVKNPLLVMTWFRDGGRTAVRYTTSQNGQSYNGRDTYPNTQSQIGRQLSNKNLGELHALLVKLPKPIGQPPINRTLVVSFERKGKWRTEVYDISSLPESLEGVLKIAGQPFGSREQRKDDSK